MVAVGHIEPTPVHVRHALPIASTWLAIVVPHGTAVGPGQSGQHEPIASQSLPAAQRVPVPGQAVLPVHVGGRLVPQSIMSAVTQDAVHVHAPATQDSPPAQGPSQWPPQPSSSPHIEVLVHVVTH